MAAQIRILFSGGRRFFGRCIRMATRSPLGHVAIGHDGLVLNPTMDGDLIHPFALYLFGTPKLSCCLTLPLRRPLGKFVADERDRSHLATAAAFLCPGRWRPSNCVTVVADVLCKSGYDVPSGILTPVQLHDWLTDAGASHESFGGPFSCDHSSCA